MRTRNLQHGNVSASPLGDQRYHGIVQEVGTSPAPVLRSKDCVRPDDIPGVATIYVQATQLRRAVALEGTTGRLIGRLFWATGQASGECFIDLEQGGVFTIGGCDNLGLEAQVVGIDNALPTPAAFFLYRVEAVVHWGTAVSPKPARFSSQRLLLAPAATSLAIPIPERASSLFLQSNAPVELANITVDFAGQPTDAPIYSVQSPSIDQPAYVSMGAQFVRFSYTGAGAPRIVPIWNLHL